MRRQPSNASTSTNVAVTRSASAGGGSANARRPCRGPPAPRSGPGRPAQLRHPPVDRVEAEHDVPATRPPSAGAASGPDAGNCPYDLGLARVPGADVASDGAAFTKTRSEPRGTDDGGEARREPAPTTVTSRTPPRRSPIAARTAGGSCDQPGRCDVPV
jgi:hypothetical protein